MILNLCSMCEAFVRIVKDTSTSISPEARVKIDEALTLVVQVREWVPTRVGEDEGDEDGDEEGAQELFAQAPVGQA